MPYFQYLAAQIAWPNSNDSSKRLSQTSASSSYPWNPLPGDSATGPSRPTTVSPVSHGSNPDSLSWFSAQARLSPSRVLTKSQRMLLDLVKSSTPLERELLPRVSPFGPIGRPVQRSPKSRLNPCSAPFVPAAAVASSPPPSTLNANAAVFHPPGHAILEANVLAQFPPYFTRRYLHDNNHSQWSQMLVRVQNANPMHVSDIQQFAESEKQMYKEGL